MDLDPRTTSPIDFDALDSSIGTLREDFDDAAPFPHVVIDGLLRPEALQAALTAFEAVGQSGWTKYLHVNERKFAHTDTSSWPSALEQIALELQSPRFMEFLSRLSGIDGLRPDPSLDGGGLHRSGRDGFLNIHADFTTHHVKRDWVRRLNLILYLNREWEEAWGGALELWPPDMRRCERAVLPAANRALIFRTTEDSFHGHPEPTACPPDVYRQSLALYYFTQEDETRRLSTNYQPRPGDGLKAVTIIADREALRLYDSLKRRLRFSDSTASAWLGRLHRLKNRFR